MTLRDELDLIWNKSLIEKSCECGNDHKWEQDITGFIICGECKQKITDEEIPTLTREKERIRKTD